MFHDVHVIFFLGALLGFVCSRRMLMLLAFVLLVLFSLSFPLPSSLLFLPPFSVPVSVSVSGLMFLG